MRSPLHPAVSNGLLTLLVAAIVMALPQLADMRLQAQVTNAEDAPLAVELKGPSIITLGKKASFAVRVKNRTSAAMGPLTIQTTFQASYTVVANGTASFSTTKKDCTLAPSLDGKSTILTCQVPSLPARGTYSVTLKAMVPSDIDQCTDTSFNVATSVSGTDQAQNVSLSGSIGCPTPKLSLALSGPSRKGNTLTYKVQLRNTGKTAVLTPTISLTAEGTQAGAVQILLPSAGGELCSISQGSAPSIVCQQSTLSKKGSMSLVIPVSITSGYCGTVTATAQGTGTFNGSTVTPVQKTKVKNIPCARSANSSSRQGGSTSSTRLSLAWDIDGNGELTSGTDGALIQRYLFGYTAENITAQAIGPGATRTTGEAIMARLDLLNSHQFFDVDGNGTSHALTDGILLRRYMAGMRGDALINAAIGDGATRTSAEAIVAYIESIQD